MIHVRMARPFDGPRHDRLSAIWDVIAEYAHHEIKLIVTPNQEPRLSHAEVFQKMWREDLECDNRFLLLTEQDFLPDLADDWLPLRMLDALDVDALGVERLTRHPETLGLSVHPGQAGGWWLLIDKHRAPAELDFAAGDDPCNELPLQMKMEFVNGIDCYPFHFGVEYLTGIHFFWSRHYHDDPSRIVAGVPMGMMQRKLDDGISEWIKSQPQGFQRLLETRGVD